MGIALPRPETSELWERLAAAQGSSGKALDEVTAALGVTEREVIAWETADAVSRSFPTAHHVLQLAKLYGLPAYLLIDDAVSVFDVKSFGGLPDVSGYETKSFRRR